MRTAGVKLIKSAPPRLVTRRSYNGCTRRWSSPLQRASVTSNKVSDVYHIRVRFDNANNTLRQACAIDNCILLSVNQQKRPHLLADLHRGMVILTLLSPRNCKSLSIKTDSILIDWLRLTQANQSQERQYRFCFKLAMENHVRFNIHNLTFNLVEHFKKSCLLCSSLFIDFFFRCPRPYRQISLSFVTQFDRRRSDLASTMKNASG